MEPITKSSTITAGDLMDTLKAIENDFATRAVEAVIIALVSICLLAGQQVLLYMVLAKIGADTTMWVVYWVSCPTMLILAVVGSINSVKRLRP